MAARPLFHHVRALLSAAERVALLAEIAAHRDRMRHLAGKGGLGPRYGVIGGDVIAQSMPLVAEVGRRARELAEQFAGLPLEPFHDPVRRARVQTYLAREDGFRWHFDGHPFVVLVTLENESEGVTELVGRWLSTLVRPLFYPAYAVPWIFSALPRRAVACAAGEALIFSGRQHLHRGRSRRDGRRTILVFAFDLPGTRPSRLRNLFARWVNY
ncbi:MAG: hypothetical protein ABI779_03610 [Acidobacteriota bacterium]